MQGSSGIRVMADVTLDTSSHDQKGARRVGLVGCVVPDRCPGRPARGIAGVQDLRAVAFGDGDLAGQHVEHLVLVLMPVLVRRPRSWLKRLKIGTVLRQPTECRQSNGVRDAE